ncbi:LOW QUALITY PROTEIN: flap endonuclease GEN-like 1 [Phoenix dactylifera]|uniref:Flap endonuclease GEN-like 1 n=1 Tax=Phoenix dactylifera TaxID=42345 RepID=A0A8B8Z980_PHODC|nr:LOW QUALITY PROTEIN: flap endonuclease GEN-like 1 [Phoenix dactylifera]
MGVAGNFWDLLKPYARNKGVDFLRNKRVAVDLSFWIVQHEAAIRHKTPRIRSPHLRTTFFRTVSLFSKMGAFPVFVVDGESSPLKAQARIERFFCNSGVDPSALPKAAEGEEAPVKQRNQAFTRCVQECVELLELLGMPVLRACGEAEALCAQLNSEGHVDACITADSDAFLFGAKCVIKCLRSNCKEPFECYYISDVEAGLGLKRKQMVAVALLVGNDYDLHGVSGFGVDTAVRFVKLFSEDEILTRLCEVGKGVFAFSEGSISLAMDSHVPISNEVSPSARSQHCSHCGHPGSKKAHQKTACEYCILNGSENCMEKPTGFKCLCSTCDKDRKTKEQKKYENWQIKMCKMIAAEQNFPNNAIIELYLSSNHGNYDEKDAHLLWDKPKVETLVEFLNYHQHWEPSYIRQRMFPMLTTIYLREVASNPNEGLLLHSQYEFHSIQRLKVRYGHPYYLIKWKKAIQSTVMYDVSGEQSESEEMESMGANGSNDMLDEPDVPLILTDNGCCFLLTDENMELVQAAFPKEVDRYLGGKEIKGIQIKRKKIQFKIWQK